MILGINIQIVSIFCLSVINIDENVFVINNILTKVRIRAKINRNNYETIEIYTSKVNSEISEKYLKKSRANYILINSEQTNMSRLKKFGNTF